MTAEYGGPNVQVMRLPTVLRQPITAAFVVGVLLESHPSEARRFPAELVRYSLTMPATASRVSLVGIATASCARLRARLDV